MADVFLSYAQVDRAKVEPLARALEAEGWSVWRDPTMVGGVDFREEIEAELGAARCVVVAWSASSVKSRWVRDEADEGLSQGVLVPVTIDGTRPPMGFRAPHTVPMADWDGSRSGTDYTQLVEGVRRVLGESAPAPEQGSRRESTAQPEPEAREAPALASGQVPPAQSSSTGSTAPPAAASFRPKSWYVAGVAAIFGAVLVVVLGVWRPWEGGSQDTVRRAPERGDIQTATVSEKPSVPVRKPFEPEMVRVPGGSFQMGSPDNEPGRADDEGPLRTVEVAPFAIGRYEVTFDEYDAFAGAAGRALPDDAGWGRGRQPVINVSFEDAKAYAGWLSEETGKRYRLPSEAEWEYAARAGTSMRWSFGDDEEKIAEHAWFGRNSGLRAREVGTRDPNPWGLRDVHGNVWEWMEDCWHGSYEGAPRDGSAWLKSDGGDCNSRVVRGGSLGSAPQGVRSATRLWLPAADRGLPLGFRLAQDL